MLVDFKSTITEELMPDTWEDLLNPAQLSLEDSIDVLGDIKAMFAFAKKLEGYMKEVVKSKMPEVEEDDPVEQRAKFFTAIINHRTRKGGLNEGLIEEEMGSDWLEEHRKPGTEYDELRVSPIKD